MTGGSCNKQGDKMNIQGRFPVRFLKYTILETIPTFLLTSSIAPSKSRCSKHSAFTNVLKTHFLSDCKGPGTLHFQICNFPQTWQPLSKIVLVTTIWLAKDDGQLD